MDRTIGEKINALRTGRGMTQEALAEELGVSPQAVSKWEKDTSIPDLPLLVKLADFFAVSVDALVRERDDVVRMLPEGARKNIDTMLLRVDVRTVKGDKVKVNLPLALVKVMADIDFDPTIKGGDILAQIDFRLIVRLIESGVIGKLVEVDTADGDHVDVWVEG